jgi:hypothetical protein
VGALEREEFSRAAWRVIVAERVEPERLVFVDEMGTNNSLSAVYAWAPKSHRARWWVWVWVCPVSTVLPGFR